MISRLGKRVLSFLTAKTQEAPIPACPSSDDHTQPSLHAGDAEALEIGRRILSYQHQTAATFGRPLMPITDSGFKLASSLAHESPYFEGPGQALFAAELRITGDLLRDIQQHDVPGAIVEFGVFKGFWLNHLYDLMKAAQLNREIWGFDSFQGLSSPAAEFDDPFWKEGMFTAGLEEVMQQIQADQRPEFKLVPGFFADSLKGEQASTLGTVSLARIDCDIYQPTVECLEYLSHRLAHGSVLVFDDWSHRVDKGETRAFFEWAPTVPHLEFEFLFLGIWDHFYVRVWHKCLDRWAFQI